MTEIAVQPSFNGGEWAPHLYARVDVAKYRSAAALLENFFVDYRGGASTRPGTKYVIQAYDSANPVRLIPYQSSFNVGYVIEVGDGYMRFIYQGAPILETAINISAATQANPCVITAVGHDYVEGDWVYITGVGGMTQLNGRYFEIIHVNANSLTLGYLDGSNLNSTAFGAYTSGGTVARIYTITSPYTVADDLRELKFAQSVNQMVLCHPNHQVYILTCVAANNWTLLPGQFGASIDPPAAPTVTTTLGAGSVNYAYVVTAIDASGQESSASDPGTLASKLDLRSNAGSNTITWTAVPGAVAYNVYEASVVYSAAVPAGSQYGFIGTTQGTTFVDSNIAQDFTITPPISRDPFSGNSVASVAVTTPGVYTDVPTVSFDGAAISPAAATVTLGAILSIIINGGTGHAVGDIVSFDNGISIRVASVILGQVFTATINNQGAVTTGNTPSQPMTQISTSGAGTGLQIVFLFEITSINVTNGGSGYTSAPTVVLSGTGGGAGTAVLSTDTINPTVPGFVQQRLTLAAPVTLPSTFYMSKVGQYYNFDVSMPTVASDAVTGTLVSGTLNTISSIVGTAAGMIIFTDKAVWLVNGGSPGSAITAINAVANPQSYIGASDVPPIVANYDMLFVQAKGSAIRQLSYNFYSNTFTGEDISIMSSHLFYGYTIEEWCWAEQPFYIAQAVRSDGTLLSLTYLKEQQFVGWSHYVTDGTFESVTSVTEVLASGVAVDAVYVIVERSINGNTVQYIERFAERDFPNGRESAWCVDAGLQYSGSPATTFTGAEHLAGETVTGLADGEIITPFTMPTNGIFTLDAAASTVTVGLAYTCQLQTLPLDTGDPSLQGLPKKIVAVDIRVVDTLGLEIGASFTTLTAMKDLVVGNVSSTLTGQASQVVTDLVTGDAFTVLDPTYTIPGQYCIEQSQPYPATVLGLFPRFAEGGRSGR